MPAEPRKIMYPRIGNLQFCLSQRGSGNNAELRFCLNKLCTEKELAADPEAANTFTLEDIALLKELCSQVLQQAYKIHTVIIPSAEIHQPDAGEPLAYDNE